MGKLDIAEPAPRPKKDRAAVWATAVALAEEFAPEMYAKSERIDPSDGRLWADLTEKERRYWFLMALFLTESNSWAKRVASLAWPSPP